MFKHLLLIFIATIFAITVKSFKVQTIASLSRSSMLLYMGEQDPLSLKNLRTKFTVEKATEESLNSMGVLSWGLWSTQGSPKYKVGIKSPKKVYDVNELSYIGNLCVFPLFSRVLTPVDSFRQNGINT